MTPTIDRPSLWRLSMLSSESYGLVLLLISAILYSIMACFVKLSTSSGFSAFELVSIRVLFQMPLIVLGMCWYKDPNAPTGSAANDKLIRRPFGSSATARSIVIARGFFGSFGLFTYYYTVSVLPLGDATTMLSMSPIITVVAASIFLNETMQISHVIAAVLGLLGSILLAQPTFLFGRHDDDNNNENDNNSIGYLTGFLGACIGASVFILVRKAGKVGVHTLQLLFSWCFFSIIYCLILGIMTIVFRSPDDHDNSATKSFLAVPKTRRSWMYVLGVCIAGTVGHFLLNYAGMLAPAGIGSMTRLSGMMWSYLLEIYVFHQLPQFRTVLGFSFILLSLVLIAVEKHYHNNNNNSSSQSIDEEYSMNNSENTRLPLLQQPDYSGSTSYCNTIDDNGKRVVL